MGLRNLRQKLLGVNKAESRNHGFDKWCWQSEYVWNLLIKRMSYNLSKPFLSVIKVLFSYHLPVPRNKRRKSSHFFGPPCNSALIVKSQPFGIHICYSSMALKNVSCHPIGSGATAPAVGGLPPALPLPLPHYRRARTGGRGGGAISRRRPACQWFYCAELPTVGTRRWTGECPSARLVHRSPTTAAQRGCPTRDPIFAPTQVIPFLSPVLLRCPRPTEKTRCPAWRRIISGSVRQCPVFCLRLHGIVDFSLELVPFDKVTGWRGLNSGRPWPLVLWCWQLASG